jgi:hypothetical protein
VLRLYCDSLENLPSVAGRLLSRLQQSGEYLAWPF